MTQTLVSWQNTPVTLPPATPPEQPPPKRPASSPLPQQTAVSPPLLRRVLGFWNRYFRLPLARFFEDRLLRRQVQQFYMVFGGHIFFQTLRTAVKLDLFGLLDRRGPMTQDQIAAELALHEQPLRIVLLGCTALGLLRKRGAKYSNSYLASRLLVPGKPGNVTAFVELEHQVMYKGMPWMYDSVLENRNVGLKEFPGDEPTIYQRLAHCPEVERIFQQAMRELSVQANADLSRFVDFSQVSHVVDIGGGDATNLIQLLRDWPHLYGTVFDSPTVCDIARQNIEAAGLQDRLRALPGDCFADPLPTGADCFLLAHFCTIWSPEKNRLLLRKCYEALPVGGQVIIFNMMQHDDGTGPLAAAVGSPYFLTIATGEGMLYTWAEYQSWLRQCGFQSLRRYRLLRNHGAIVGRKTAQRES
jgi:hypothetical protein